MGDREGLDLCLIAGPLSSRYENLSFRMAVEYIFTFLSKHLLSHIVLITRLRAGAKCSLSPSANEYVIVSQEIKKPTGQVVSGSSAGTQVCYSGTPGRPGAGQWHARTWHSVHVCECAHE